jgi:hypothetical protein
MAGNDVSIQTYLHPNARGSWITFTVTVGGRFDLALVLDPGAPVSAISPTVRQELRSLGLLGNSSRPRYHRLTALTVQGQPFPELEVRVLPRLSQLEVDGLVGLDFLRQFAAIHFYVPTMRLVLEAPP